MTAPLLAYPDFKLPFTIHCDASNIAVGAVIAQTFDNKFRRVMYGSRHLTAAESRYRAKERELLAIGGPQKDSIRIFMAVMERLLQTINHW